MALVRRVMVIKGHRVSVLEIQRQLEENGKRFDWHYINKLKKKIEAERIKRIDYTTKNEFYNQFADAMAESMQQAYAIIYSKTSRKGEIIAALKEVRETYIALFNAKADLGFFERNLGTVSFRPEMTLSQKKVAELVETMIRFHVLPDQANESNILASPGGSEAPREPEVVPPAGG